MTTLKSTISVGDLKHVARIQRSVITSDDYGFQIEQWKTIATVRCKTEFDDRLMREIFTQDGANSVNVKIFTFRFIKDLRTTDRIVFNNVDYEIYGFNDVDDAGRFLKVWARKVVS